MNHSYNKKNNFISKDLIVYGRQPVIEALETGQSFEKLYFKAGMDARFIKNLKSKCVELEIPFQGVPSVKLNKITNQNHQGVVLFLAQIKYYKIEDILSQVYASGELPLFLILDGITDIHNMGAIARTAWATGAQAIIVPHKGSASINAEAIKKSAGALMHIPVCRTINLLDSVNFLKNNGLTIISLGLQQQSKWLHELDTRKPMGIIMGAEGSGLSQKVVDLSDEIVKIPMANDFDSYNVSVAAAMVLYESMKQRMLEE